MQERQHQHKAQRAKAKEKQGKEPNKRMCKHQWMMMLIKQGASMSPLAKVARACSLLLICASD
jgi:hypothetical protein